MTKYNFTIYSKDKKSLNYFLEFINYICKIQNTQIIKKLSKKKKTKKKISVLKSPHVNKTAQEQFEYIYYSIQILFYSWEIQKYFTLIKKIKNQLFPDILIKINFSKQQNKLINLNKVSFSSTTKTRKKQKRKTLTFKKNFKNKNKLKNTTIYLKTLDYYGKIQKSLDSSVGRAKD